MLLAHEKEQLKWIAGVALTVSAIVGLTLLDFNHSESRTPASIQPTQAPENEKSSVLRNGKPGHLHSFGKPSGLVEVEIQLLRKSENSDGAVLELEAQIEAQSDLQNMKFGWILPKDGVTILSGPDSGDIGTLNAGQQTSLKLTIQTATRENRQIHLNVFKLVDGEPNGKMAQYNTVNQEAIEADIRSKAETLNRAAEASGETDKVIQ